MVEQKNKTTKHWYSSVAVVIILFIFLVAVVAQGFDIGDASVCPNGSFALTTSGLWACQSANFVNWTNGTNIINRIDTIQSSISTARTNGTATLVAGTVTINTTAIHYNSKVFYSYQNSTGLNVGQLIERNRIEGTSFDIKDVTTILDTNTIAWEIVN